MSIELAALAAGAVTATSVAAITGWIGRAPVDGASLRRAVVCKTGDRAVVSCTIHCDAEPDPSRGATARAVARQWGDRVEGRMGAILQHAVSDAAEGFSAHAVLHDADAFHAACEHILATEFDPLGRRVARFEVTETRLLKSLSPVPDPSSVAPPALAA